MLLWLQPLKVEQLCWLPAVLHVVMAAKGCKQPSKPADVLYISLMQCVSKVPTADIFQAAHVSEKQVRVHSLQCQIDFVSMILASKNVMCTTQRHTVITNKHQYWTTGEEVDKTSWLWCHMDAVALKVTLPYWQTNWQTGRQEIKHETISTPKIGNKYHK